MAYDIEGDCKVEGNKRRTEDTPKGNVRKGNVRKGKGRSLASRTISTENEPISLINQLEQHEQKSEASMANKPSNTQ